jgi:hypothetical protein
MATEKGYSGNWKRLSMSTTVLAYLILFMGFITFLCGAFGVLMLPFEEVSKTQRVQFRCYAMVIGLISPWHDRYWAGPAAADPWQTRLTHGYDATREAAMGQRSPRVGGGDRPCPH